MTQESNSTQHLTTENFDQVLAEAKNAGKPLFVDFYADWCGPCKIAAPIIDQLASEYEGKAVVAKLNVDDHREIAQRYNIMSIPTVLVFGKDGDQLDTKIGFIGESAYRDMLETALAS